MMRPTEGLQDNQRLDQMWADGWWFWTLEIDILERTIGHRSLRYQNYEQHWRKDASNFQCNGVRIRQAFNTFGVVMRQTLHTGLMTSLHQILDDQ